jgi:D-lactate dehydrogenase (cytochrome)
MASHRIRVRAARGRADHAGVTTDPDLLASVREDAAHYHGGHAAGLAFPLSEADVAAICRTHSRILPIGAQSSLTGGATPFGDLVVSTAAMREVVDVTGAVVRVQPGVSITALEDRLAPLGLWYPPAPTWHGAFVGGTVATNAAGAATFKYGSTRRWVEGLTVVLASGDVLDLERGACRAHPDGYFEIERPGGVTRVLVPTYVMPDVPKHSAGYHAEPGMDLIDLFIGSEGTLGIVTAISLRVAPRPAAACVAFVPVPDETAGLALVARLRRDSERTWASGDRDGLDVAAIEHLDRRCLELLTEDGEARRHEITLPGGTALALLVQLELATRVSNAEAYAQIASEQAPATSLQRFCGILRDAGVFDDTELALPEDGRRAAQFVAFREAAPAAVKSRIAAAKRDVDPRIEKTAADMIVPFGRLSEMLAIYRAEFAKRGLDVAVWGHISDGNVHPNVVPRSYEDVIAGREAILQCGREVRRLGGCPLAEHGVGRSPVKQALLAGLYGDAALEDMRAVKRALDPEWKLAPGVLFEPPRSRRP